jgi:adenosylcobinamide-phosphate synthase
MLNHPAFILAAAFLLDLLIGDPPCPLHPVRLTGHLIRQAEKFLRALKINLLAGGVLLVAITLTVLLASYALLSACFGQVVWVLNLLIVYSLLALKDLVHHALAVRNTLHDGDLSGAQAAVQMIVGRNAALLDAHGVARATVESAAENFVDGFLSPVFWYALGAILFQNTAGGIALLLIYKAASTLDSMVGYRNDRYLLFGRAGARLDDLMNFIPARLSIPLIAATAWGLSMDFKSAWRIGWRDRLKHSSPNSAHAEAAVAGALNLRLGGPTAYAHGTVEKPWLGDGSPDAVAADITRAVTLILLCGTFALLAAIAVLI